VQPVEKVETKTTQATPTTQVTPAPNEMNV